VQALLPDRQALASGLALGFMFFGGAAGSYVLGVIADQVGLAPALQWSALLMLAAAAAALFLPARRATKVLAAAD
jgi:predicted MFS family arabinose efflux permease